MHRLNLWGKSAAKVPLGSSSNLDLLTSQSLQFWQERALEASVPEYTHIGDRDVLLHGTLNMMVERALVDFQKAEYAGLQITIGSFAYDFLCTYGLCPPGTPEFLLNKLVNEVYHGPPKGVMGKDEELEVLALPNTICALLAYWYRLRPFEWETETMQQVWADFVDKIIDRHAGVRRKIPDCIHLFDYRLRTKGRDLNFNNIDVEALAKEITVMEHRLLRNIDLVEFKGCAWMKATKPGTERSAPNILKAIEFFNNVTLWVAAMILCQEDDDDRALMISRFIRLAKSLKQLRNYNSTMAVYMALTGVIVQRMKTARALVDVYSTKTLDRLKDFCEPDNNYAVYRAEVASLSDSDFFIPALGVLLKDIAAIVEAVPDKDETGLYNGIKISKLAKMLTPLLRLRELRTLGNEDWLEALITVMLQPRYSYDELVKMSDRVRKGESIQEIQDSMKAANEESKAAAASVPDSIRKMSSTSSPFTGRIPYHIQLFLDMSSQGVVVIDEEGIVRGFNRAAANLFGYTESEVIEQPIEMLMPAHVRETHQRHISHLKKGFEAQTLNHERHVRALHKDGTEFSLMISLGQLNKDETNGISYVGFFSCPDRRVMSMESFRALFDHSSFGVILMDSQGTMKAINSKTELMTGYTEDELLGHCNTMLLPLENRERLGAVVAEAVSSSNRALYGHPEPVTMRHKDGTTFKCRTVLNDVGLNDHTEGKHALLYLEESSTATSREEIINEVREDNMQTQAEALYLESLLNVVDTTDARILLTVSPDTPVGIKKLVDKIFESHDTDNDMVLTAEEYADVATNFPFLDPFESIDSNSDGKVTHDELEAFLFASCYVALILRSLDANKDGKIREDDFKSLKAMLPGVQFTDVDVDQNGEIDMIELKKFLTSNVHLLKPSG